MSTNKHVFLMTAETQGPVENLGENEVTTCKVHSKAPCLDLSPFCCCWQQCQQRSNHAVKCFCTELHQMLPCLLQ